MSLPHSSLEPQSERQPSAERLLPSSQTSGGSTVPLPQYASRRHTDEHPSPSAVLPSSHPSPPSMRPLPQLGPGGPASGRRTAPSTMTMMPPASSSEVCDELHPITASGAKTKVVSVMKRSDRMRPS